MSYAKWIVLKTHLIFKDSRSWLQDVVPWGMLATFWHFSINRLVFGICGILLTVFNRSISLRIVIVCFRGTVLLAFKLAAMIFWIHAMPSWFSEFLELSRRSVELTLIRNVCQGTRLGTRCQLNNNEGDSFLVIVSRKLNIF